MINQPIGGISGRRVIENALALHRAGRLGEAEALYRQAVEAEPGQFDALHLLGVVCSQQGRSEEAVAHLAAALERNPSSAEAHYNLGVALTALGRQSEAADSFLRAIGLNATHARAHHRLGLALQVLDRFEEAAGAAQTAVTLVQDFAEGHFALGTALAKLKRYDEAVAAFRRALAIQPAYPEALLNLGNVLMEQEEFDLAAQCFTDAVALRDDVPEAHFNLGNALMRLNRAEDALPCFERAVFIKPNYPEALNNLGLALTARRRYDEAIEAYLKAVSLRPDYVEVYSHLGTAYYLSRRFSEALMTLQKALVLDPNDVGAHSTIIEIIDFTPGTRLAEQQAERSRWYNLHGKRFSSEIRPFFNDRNPERKLRVGYVSADFRRHSAAAAFGSMIRHADRSQFDVVLYSSVKKEDDVTASFRTEASLWRDVIALSDDELAEVIRADQIDILVDLSGHSKGNRLLAFARKPAPIQVTAWGHATGTGVATIDYLFSDPVAVPVDDRHLFAEEIFDLPCLLGFDPLTEAPEVVSPPVVSSRSITFGCFNRLNKVADETFDLWSCLLDEVSDARIVLKDPALIDPIVQHRIMDKFRDRGISPQRLVMLPGTSHVQHLAAYGQVDIALDPLPVNGGVTTLEALWMGVPVVALHGPNTGGRVSAAILTALGLSDWVAKSKDDYVLIARNKAADIESLVMLRKRLRSIMQSSPVGDPVQYCRAVEAAYRAMWRKFCTI